jgi:Fe-S cluster assembly ATP-binding protein
MGEFLQRLETARTRCEVPKEWLNRSMNVGFSGGEKKRLAFLRLLMTRPKLAILDEPDSGADAAAQKLFAEIIKDEGCAFLFISHQEKFTELVSPTEITELANGKIKADC